MPTWNKKLADIVAHPPLPWQQHSDMPDEERQKEYQRLHEMDRIMKKASEFHAVNFSGRRWPEFETAAMVNVTEFWRPMRVYLNNITEEWPEGQAAFINDITGRHSADSDTINYLMKKGVEAPGLTEYYHAFLSPRAVRGHLNRRLKELNDDLQAELAKPKPVPKPASDPDAIDDQDEFSARRMRYTIKQLQNRIKVVQQTMKMSDAELSELMIEKRPKTAAAREALILPWAPSAMRAYIDKHVFKK